MLLQGLNVQAQMQGSTLWRAAYHVVLSVIQKKRFFEKNRPRLHNIVCHISPGTNRLPGLLDTFHDGSSLNAR